jgi:hypothetical protein
VKDFVADESETEKEHVAEESLQAEVHVSDDGTDFDATAAEIRSSKSGQDAHTANLPATKPDQKRIAAQQARPMCDTIIYSSVWQVSELHSDGHPVKLCTHGVVPIQGETVLANFTTKKGNFLNVVQRIVKTILQSYNPLHDHDVLYGYGK